jgi:hypothetical protein
MALANVPLTPNIDIPNARRPMQRQNVGPQPRRFCIFQLLQTFMSLSKATF